MHMDRARHVPEDLETYKIVERSFIGKIIRLKEEAHQKFIDDQQISYENGFWYKDGVILHLSDIEFEPIDREFGHDPDDVWDPSNHTFLAIGRISEDPGHVERTHQILLRAHLMVEKMKQRALVRTPEDRLIEQTPDIDDLSEQEEESAATLATMEAAAVVPESQVVLQSNIMTTDGDRVPADSIETTTREGIASIQNYIDSAEYEDRYRTWLNSSGAINHERLTEAKSEGQGGKEEDYDEEEGHASKQLQQQESEPSPSHSSASAKTNNDNEDNNNNPDSLEDHNQVSETPSSGRIKRVSKKNRIYEDFYCVKPKKGGRLGSHNEYYEVFAPSASATRSSDRRSTIESRSKESLEDVAGASETDQNTNKSACDPTELIAPMRHCKRCRKRTAHDLDRKCQVCLYKRIQSASKRQETLRLKAQATATAAAAVVATGVDPNQQDEVKEAEQSRATSASSSVANTPTSLDGSLMSANGVACNSGGSRNKRKARSQGGRSSKQPAATPSSLPTMDDFEDSEMPKANSDHVIKPTIEPEINTSQSKADGYTGRRLIQFSAASQQDKHNTSSSSDTTTDTNITGGSSTATTSGDTSASSFSNTQTSTAAKQTTPTTNTLKITTTLKTDEKGKKRWVVKSSGGEMQNDENASASAQRESDLPSSQASSVAEMPSSQQSGPEPVKVTPQNMGKGDTQTEQGSAIITPTKPERPAAKKPSDTRSAPMERSNGVGKANTNKIINNSSQTIGDDSQNQPQLTKVDAWTPEDVAQYVSSRGFSDQSELFKVQAVDGMSLLLMKRTDFTHGLKMKLGPALKLFDQVCKLKREYFALSATAS